MRTFESEFLCEFHGLVQELFTILRRPVTQADQFVFVEVAPPAVLTSDADRGSTLVCPGHRNPYSSRGEYLVSLFHMLGKNRPQHELPPPLLYHRFEQKKRESDGMPRYSSEGFRRPAGRERDAPPVRRGRRTERNI